MIKKYLGTTIFYVLSIITLAILITLLAIKMYTKKTIINLDLVEITYENKINNQGQYHIVV
jgi:hypothetical protein